MPISELPSPLVAPLTDNAELIKLVAEISGKPEDDVRRLLYEEEVCLGAHYRRECQEWGVTNHVYNDRMDDYYREAEFGLYGMPIWNRRPEKTAMRRWIGEYLRNSGRGDLDILTVGDGAGFDSAYLAQCGHRVTYSEESTPAIAMARKIFAMNKLDVTVVDDRRWVKEACYDVVVCLDVLEHVQDPVQMVAAFSKCLRPGGLLIVHAPFFFVNHLNPTHLASNICFSGSLRRLYGVNNLHLVDGNTCWDPIVLAKPDLEGSLPKRSWPRLFKLRVMGLLLSTARICRIPHNWIAGRTMQTGDSEWLSGLAPTSGEAR